MIYILEPVKSVLPTPVFSNFILSLLKSGSNLVFSPVSLLKLIHLVHSLGDPPPAGATLYLEQGLGTLHDLYKNIPFFKTSININVSCMNDVSPGLNEAVHLAGATLEVTSDTCDSISILNLNNLQVPLKNAKMSEESFIVNSKLIKVIPMAVICSEMIIAKFEQWQIVEMSVNPELILQILLPDKITGLKAVLNSTNGVITSAGRGVTKTVELKLPIFLAGW